MSKKICSIIIRTKDEERWISLCLDAVFNQSYTNFEVIIVDNNSTDKTIEKAKKYDIKEIVKIDNYLPGKALNLGIKKSSGKYVVCMSAHCIPTNEEWLNNLVSALEEDDGYAGVYGRQEPMSFFSNSDKRDLLLVFGLDRKIQEKDSFFHNANSIIRRKLWEEIPFDEKITNIEDRIWAQEILNLGYKLLYEPGASVYHYHGIHQGENQNRLQNVVKIIEDRFPNNKTGKLDPNRLKIIAIIPVRGKSRIINHKPLINYTIESAMKSKYIDRVIVSTDSEETAKMSISAGAECPFIRPASISKKHVNLETVQKFSLEKIESNGYIPDLIVHMEEIFPFRPIGLIDSMIIRLLMDGFDSVIAARKESGFIWQENTIGRFIQLDSGDVPHMFKENTLVGIHGLGVITRPNFIRCGQLLGDNCGLYKIEYSLANFEVRSDESAVIASKILR